MRLIALGPADLDQRLGDLAAILHACVLDGASVGFVLPFAPAEAAAFFRDKVRPRLAAGERLLLAAEIDGRLAATVQLGLDTPANQPHRAEVAKLLVHPRARRRGLARALMGRLEAEARARGRSLLTLDTRTGDMAEPLYLSLGFQPAGVIPGYCRDAGSSRLDATTIMWKTLDAPS